MTGIPLTFRSQHTGCAAWHYPASGGAFDGPDGRPCVVMAHGFGATHDSGLGPFAQALAAAGLEVLAFDYRGFGESSGLPRQVADVPGQLEDYRAAVAAARALDGVDPGRIVLWGVSFAGGHVLRLAAEERGVVAVVALTPAADGLAATTAIVRREGVRAARLVLPALRDAACRVLGRDPHRIPLAGPPGAVAALTAPGAHESYTAIVGPEWRNEVAARALLQLPRYRPGRSTPGIAVPLLVQVADLDQTAPAGAAVRAAGRAPWAEVRHYPCDHFDVYAGRDRHEAVVAHQIAFLRRHLGARDHDDAIHADVVAPPVPVTADERTSP